MSYRMVCSGVVVLGAASVTGLLMRQVQSQAEQIDQQRRGGTVERTVHVVRAALMSLNHSFQILEVTKLAMKTPFYPRQEPNPVSYTKGSALNLLEQIKENEMKDQPIVVHVRRDQENTIQYTLAGPINKVSPEVAWNIFQGSVTICRHAIPVKLPEGGFQFSSVAVVGSDQMYPCLRFREKVVHDILEEALQKNIPWSELPFGDTLIVQFLRGKHFIFPVSAGQIDRASSKAVKAIRERRFRVVAYKDNEGNIRQIVLVGKRCLHPLNCERSQRDRRIYVDPIGFEKTS